MITTALGAGGEEPFGGRARLVHGVGDRPVGNRQSLGDEQRLGVGFLDLHAMRLRCMEGERSVSLGRDRQSGRAGR